MMINLCCPLQRQLLKTNKLRTSALLSSVNPKTWSLRYIYFTDVAGEITEIIETRNKFRDRCAYAFESAKALARRRRHLVPAFAVDQAPGRLLCTWDIETEGHIRWGSMRGDDLHSGRNILDPCSAI